MLIIEQEKKLESIEALIEGGFAEEACNGFIELISYVYETDRSNNRDFCAKVFASFSQFLFQIGEYSECLKYLYEAQECGYPSSIIHEMIYGAYIEPNLEEFKSNYETNAKFLSENKCIDYVAEFSDLNYYLIPTTSDLEYYLYNKDSMRIEEKLDFKINDLVDKLQESDNEFSDYLVLNNWNLSSVINLISKIHIKKKHSYFVIDDFEKFISCFQGIKIESHLFNNLTLFSSLTEFKDFFYNNSNYLPRNIIDLNGRIVEARDMIDVIHIHRCSIDGRNRDNILLSICIPSWNRGNEALEHTISLLDSEFDHEIEIVVSNNGSDNDTVNDYDKINLIEDSRIVYYDSPSNMGFSGNVVQVCTLANGKFALLCSDHDRVDINQIHKVLAAIVKYGKDVGIIRTKTDNQGHIPSTKYCKAGQEAMLEYMLRSNYMPGMMINIEMFHHYNVARFIKENKSNSACLYYTHMIIELLLLQYADVIGIDLITCIEGKSKSMEKLVSYSLKDEVVDISSEMTVPKYATIEMRLVQHIGFFDVFKKLEICKRDWATFRLMYIKLFQKTMFLVDLSIRVFYIKTDVDLLELFDRTFRQLEKNLYEVYSVIVGKRTPELDAAWISDTNNLKAQYINYTNFYRK